MKRSIYIIIILVGLIAPQISTGLEVYDFNFTTLDNQLVSFSDLGDKPILIDWAASWCIICKQTQVGFNDIYEEYKDLVSFYTISYWGSGDSIDQVAKMKSDSNFAWVFGLDTENFAEPYNTTNGHVWVLNKDFTIGQRRSGRS